MTVAVESQKSSTKGVSAGRPSYHFVAPKGWMNDPCAPGYDARTGTFHLFYQWTPYTYKWDDIAWGHATSKDMLHWAHKSEDNPVFKCDQPYDCKGIFTGCFYPTGPNGEEDQLSVFYTSVSYTPIHWSFHPRGAEGLAMAVSKDGGKTWDKCVNNPIMTEEPPELVVGGFRDPSLAPWPAMDAARGIDPAKGTLYGVISGSIRNAEKADELPLPRNFFFKVDPSDLTKWTYLNPLVRVPPNARPGGRWGGDLGTNLECTNFLSLTTADGRLTREFIITGSEGGKRILGSVTDERSPDARARDVSYGPWLMGTLQTADGEVDLDIRASGLIDFGILYAYNGFDHPDGRRILWGWMKEEDLTDHALAVKTWTGCLGVPREIFLETFEGVTGGLVSKLEDIKTFEVVEPNTVACLGIRPMREIAELRGAQLFETTSLDGERLNCVETASLACDIEATVTITDETEEVTLLVRCSSDLSTQTAITFYPKKEELVVHRGASNTATDINKTDDIGAFTLLRRVDGSIEPLRLRVLLDHDVIEVFANDRCAIATRVYTSTRCTGISYAAKGGAKLEQLQIWEMTATNA